MTDDAERGRPRMDDVDHTHPHTDAPFGDNGVYDRGPEDATEVDESETTDEPSEEGVSDGRAGSEATREKDDDDEGEPVRTDGGTTPNEERRPEWAVHRRPGTDIER